MSHAPVTLESLQGNKYVNTYQQKPFTGEIRIAYRFLEGDKADYSGMAELYSGIVFDDAGDDPLDIQPEVALDVVMNIDKMQRFLGIPYEGEEVLTTYGQLTAILNDLKERGVTSRAVNLLGWEKNGINHDARIKRSNKVGSKEDMEQFMNYIREQGDTLFFDASVTRVLTNESFDGYSQGFNTVKLLDRKDAVLYPFSLATKTQDRTLPEYYLVSPVRGSHVYDNAVKAVESYGLPGFAFRYAGYELHSEYFERSEVPRQDAIDYIEELFDRIEEKGADILLRGGNSYTLDDAAFITETELSSSEYLIADRTVPFLPMVLSGNRQFTGDPINLADSERDSFLKILETGAVPLYKIIYEENSLLVNTLHDDLYSVTYDNWSDEIVAWVQELKSVRSQINSTRIIDHSYIDDETVVVEYENGIRLVVNYGDDAVEYNEVVVPGEDYAIVR